MTYSIHPEAPTDAEGHPVHPDHGRPICGRTKSDRTTPTEHGRERDDVPYCLLTAGHGTEEPKRTGEPGVPCSHHGGNAPKGEANGSFNHGAYSEFQDFVYDSLTEDERDAVEGIDFEEHGDDFAKDVVREAYAKYLRSGDDRFLREARQWAKDFGVIESPAEQLEVSGGLDNTNTVELDDDTRDVVREVLRARRGETDE